VKSQIFEEEALTIATADDQVLNVVVVHVGEGRFFDVGASGFWCGAEISLS